MTRARTSTDPGWWSRPRASHRRRRRDVESVFRAVYEEGDEFDGDFDEEFSHLFDDESTAEGD